MYTDAKDMQSTVHVVDGVHHLCIKLPYLILFSTCKYQVVHFSFVFYIAQKSPHQGLYGVIEN